METMTDTDPMPFGKYRGQPMQDVPVDYLHWYWHNATMRPEVKEYIEKSIDALKQEKPDLIWERR